jgi:hypothetical protein
VGKQGTEFLTAVLAKSFQEFSQIGESRLRDHKCKTCPYAASNSSDLDKHIKAVHDKIKERIF